MSLSDSDSEVEKKKVKKEKKNKKEKKALQEKKEKKRARRSSDSSDTSIEDRDAPLAKKTKVEESKGSKATVSGKRMTNADGDEMFELGKMRYVTVRSFKGHALVDIREYYMDKGSGTLKPGKKGISLSGEQFRELKGLFGEIDDKLKSI